MRDSAKRIARDDASLFMKQFKQKCFPFIESIQADNSKCCFVTIEYDKSGSETHAVKGLMRVNDSVLVECDSKDRVIVVDGKKKEVLNAEGADLSGLKRNEIVDLNVDGDRWEGDVLNDELFGWGVVYNKNNDMIYEGFRIGEVNVCYGVKYDADASRIEYEGEWCNGKRCGRGTQYDRNGSLLYKGEWVNDAHLEREVIITPENALLHNFIEELIVSDGCSNGEEWSALDVCFMPSIKLLKVGNNCFKYMNGMELIGLKKLKSVVIGESSFTKEIPEDPYRDEWKRIDPSCRFCVENCPSLTEVKIGCYSFPNYYECDIKDCDALEVIQIGDLEKKSRNFFYGSLTLQRGVIHKK